MTVDFKTAFFDSVLEPFLGRDVQMLDLGSGISRHVSELLQRHPNVSYTGVEPNESARAAAKRLLEGMPRVTLEGGWGESLAARYANTFDVTVSLSVLEHVKRLNEFLATSVAVTVPGGLVAHRYDLGHALYPASIGERMRVFSTQLVPWAVPASRYTSYPNLNRIKKALSQYGLANISVEYGQIHGLKVAMNHVAALDPPLAARIVEVDTALAERLAKRLNSDELARLFPSITIRGWKK
jgi:hypothetical protein